MIISFALGGYNPIKHVPKYVGSRYTGSIEKSGELFVIMLSSHANNKEMSTEIVIIFFMILLLI
jgi:hypothetical protein